MLQQLGTYLHILDRNELSDGSQILHVKELPPPYSSCEQQQSADSDWKDDLIAIKPVSDRSSKYGFIISGGTDMEHGPSIVVTHIEHCSTSCPDNGRSHLRLFDRILAINNVDLTHVTHDEAVQAFSLFQGQHITLRIRRLNPARIEHIDFVLPTDSIDEPLGFSIGGGLDEQSVDGGLYITYIDPNGLLASTTKTNQLQIGDRLLEIKTNYTSANLQRVTHSTAVQLIRRICQDSRRVTLVVAHQASHF